MNKTFITIATSLLAAALPGVAHAQSTASASATGSTTIIRPITITKTADMSFGTIVKPVTGTAGVQILNNVDELNLEVGVAALDQPVSRAKFTIEGEGGQAVSVSVPASFTMSQGAETLDVVLEPDLGASVTLSNALGSSGTAALNIGGYFYVPSDTPSGVYSGSFTVTVAYQ
ncbi:MAG: hypothetical protein RL671_1603 [Pseudomonadota bacterium]